MGNVGNFYFLAASFAFGGHSLKLSMHRDPHWNYLQNSLSMTPGSFPVQALDPWNKVTCSPVFVRTTRSTEVPQARRMDFHRAGSGILIFVRL